MALQRILDDNKNPQQRLIDEEKRKKKAQLPDLRGVGDKVVADIQARVKAQNDAGEAKQKAELKKRVEAVKNVPVKTKYGTFDAEAKGYGAFSVDEKRAWLEKTRKEIEDNEDALRANTQVQGPYRTGEKPPMATVKAPTENGYAETKPTSEGEELGKMFVKPANEYLKGTIFGVKDAATKNPFLRNAAESVSGGLRKASEAIKVPESQGATGNYGDGSALFNGPSGFLNSTANLIDPKVDPLGTAQAAGEVALAVEGARQGFGSLKSAAKNPFLRAAEEAKPNPFLRNVESTPVTTEGPQPMQGPKPMVKAKALGRVVEEPVGGFPKTQYRKDTGGGQYMEPPKAGDLGGIKAGARKSIQEELRPRGKISDDALQAYVGPKEAFQKGKDLFDSGADMRKLAKGLATTPRAIKPEETTALIHHIGALDDERKALKGLESTLSPEEYLARFDRTNSDIQEAYDAIRKGGREASASLNSLRAVLRDDMSMDTGADLITKVSGKAPSSEQMKALQELQVRHDALSTQLDHVNTRLDEASREIANLKAAKTATTGQARAKAGAERFTVAKDEFKELWDKLNATEDGVTRLGSGSPFTTEELIQLSKPVYKMVRAAVEVGYGSTEHIFEKVAQHISEITGKPVTADHVNDIYDYTSGQTKNRMGSLSQLNEDIKYAQKGGRVFAQKKLKLLSKQAQELETEIKLARSERNKIVRDSADPTVAEKANGFLNTWQLTDPVARAMDFTANAVKLGGYSIESPIRKLTNAGVNKATKSGFIDPGIGSPVTKMGRDRFKRVFEGYGGSVKERFSSEATHGKYGISTGGGFTNAGYKFAGYSDAPAKEIYYRIHLDAQAEELARAQLGPKASPAAIDARTRYYTRTATASMKQAAEDFADLQTFNSKSAIQKVSRSIAESAKDAGGKWGEFGGKQTTRFWNVMANVAQDRIERTVVGSTVGSVHEMVKLRQAFKEAGVVDPVAARKLAALVAKGSTGAAIYYAGKYYQKTYGGISEIKRNPEGGSAWLDNGIWDQIGGPMSQFISGANEAEIEKNGGKDKDALRFKNNVSMVFSQPLFTQTQNIMNLVGNSDPKKFEKTAGNMLGSYFIPGPLKRAAKIFDTNDPNTSWLEKVMQGRPVESKSGASEFMKNVPGLRNRLRTKKLVKGGR